MRNRLTVAVLLLLLSPADAREPKRDVGPERLYLRQRITDVELMPTCTPLQIAKSGPKSSKLTHPLGRWGPVTLTAAAYDAAGPSAAFGDCLKAAPEYEARYTQRQVEAFETGRLTIGMPAEFALMLLGPPHTVNGAALEAGTSTLPRTAALEWFPWRASLQVDATGRIERIQLAGAERTALFVDGDAKAMSVTSRRRGVVISTRDSAHADYVRAMGEYDAGDPEVSFSVLLKLAEAGHAAPQCEVGDMLYRGDGVPKDLDQAVRWIRLAAASFQPRALYRLGLLQLHGEGVAQDSLAAYVSMRLAAQFGVPDAEQVVDRLERELDSAQLASAKEQLAASGLREPVLIHRVEPEFPQEIKGNPLRSRVAVQAVIATDGSVSDLELLQAHPLQTGWSSFVKATMEAVSRWRYEPARRADTGEPVATPFTVSTDFERQ